MVSRVGDEAGKDDAAVLLVEMRHRLANCFQLMSSLTRLRGRSVENAEARDLLAWFSGVLVAMGRLQQRLAASEGRNFVAYLRESASFWNTIGMDQQISVTVEAEDGQAISDQQATILALIINELVTNCLEHAFTDQSTGKITIRFRATANHHVMLEVVDNGIGHHDALARLGNGAGNDGGGDGVVDGTNVSSGLLLVRYLAASLRGRFEITPGKPSGMIARVVFPVVQRVEDDQAAGA
jgi:two-component sensor histidine kinase